MDAMTRVVDRIKAIIDRAALTLTAEEYIAVLEEVQADVDDLLMASEEDDDA